MSTTQKPNIFTKLIDIISGIFMPIINVLMAAALLKGILILITNLGWINSTDGTYQILFAAADGFFYFLPVFLAYSAAKKLKADPYTAVLIAAALLYPSITTLMKSGAGTAFLGIPVRSLNYPTSVIPIILAVALLHFVEIPLEKYIPNTIKGFMKPLLSVMIVVPITFLLFGPIGDFIGDAIAGAYSVIYNFSPILAGAVFGFIWQPSVIFGFQWGMVPAIINNINTIGMDTFLPLVGPAVLGQAGAAMAVSLKAKNKNLKAVAMSSSFAAILGVTEPTLFGITVPLKRPMLAACIAGAIGGAIVGTSHAGAIAFAFPSMSSLVVYLGEGFWVFFFAMILAFILSFILTLLFGFNEQDFNKKAATEDKN
jgi:Phosphotransferase system IIC components, glucose/maltose/N-acetylglucosamine-specific